MCVCVYVYIYVCVCVCVCIQRTLTEGGRFSTIDLLIKFACFVQSKQ